MNAPMESAGQEMASIMSGNTTASWKRRPQRSWLRHSGGRGATRGGLDHTWDVSPNRLFAKLVCPDRVHEVASRDQIRLEGERFARISERVGEVTFLEAELGPESQGIRAGVAGDDVRHRVAGGIPPALFVVDGCEAKPDRILQPLILSRLIEPAARLCVALLRQQKVGHRHAGSITLRFVGRGGFEAAFRLSSPAVFEIQRGERSVRKLVGRLD